jgi:hypothetical protein
VAGNACCPFCAAAINAETPHKVETLRPVERKHLQRMRNFRRMRSFHVNGPRGLPAPGKGAAARNNQKFVPMKAFAFQ